MNLIAKILSGILVVVLLGISVVLFKYFSWRSDKLDALQSGGTVVETTAGPIEYVLKGDRGPIRLFFHGTPGGYDAGPNAGADYRLLIPSRAGYLRTPLTVGKTLEEQADAYAALLDALGIKGPVQVMGTSGGGPSAIAFAARYPQRTSALLLESPVSQKFTAPDVPLFMKSDFTGWLMLSLLTRYVDKATLVKMLIQDPDGSARILKDPDKTKRVSSILWSLWPMSLRNPGAMNDKEQFTRLPLAVSTITAPTLIMHGTSDRSVPFSDSEKLAAQIPNTTLYPVEGGGHMIPFTHEDELDKVINNFLREHQVIP